MSDPQQTTKDGAELAAAGNDTTVVPASQLWHDVRIPWPDPSPEMRASPEFEAVWQCIKRWDINVPGAYGGYCGATGNHVRAILDAVSRVPQSVDVQAIAAIAWRCIRECKNYEGPPVMCPAHQQEAHQVGSHGNPPVSEAERQLAKAQKNS